MSSRILVYPIYCGNDQLLRKNRPWERWYRTNPLEDIWSLQNIDEDSRGLASGEQVMPSVWIEKERFGSKIKYKIFRHQATPHHSCGMNCRECRGISAQKGWAKEVAQRELREMELHQPAVPILVYPQFRCVQSLVGKYPVFAIKNSPEENHQFYEVIESYKWQAILAPSMSTTGNLFPGPKERETVYIIRRPTKDGLFTYAVTCVGVTNTTGGCVTGTYVSEMMVTDHSSLEEAFGAALALQGRSLKNEPVVYQPGNIRIYPWDVNHRDLGHGYSSFFRKKSPGSPWVLIIRKGPNITVTQNIEELPNTSGEVVWISHGEHTFRVCNNNGLPESEHSTLAEAQTKAGQLLLTFFPHEFQICRRDGDSWRPLGMDVELFRS